MNLKEGSTFAECLFGEIPSSPHYLEGSGYSVLLLLSDDSPLQEYLTELRLIIWLLVGKLGILLDYRRVNVCLVQLTAGLPLPLHLSSPFQSTLRWEQDSLSHKILHSCITIEQVFAFCGRSGLQEEWWSTHADFDSDLILEKAASRFIINHYGCLTRGLCRDAVINLSTCHQPWKTISHNEDLLFLYCYFKDYGIKGSQTHFGKYVESIPTYFPFQLLLLLIPQVVVILRIWWEKSLIWTCSLLRMVRRDGTLHATSFPALLFYMILSVPAVGQCLHHWPVFVLSLLIFICWQNCHQAHGPAAATECLI